MTYTPTTPSPEKGDAVNENNLGAGSFWSKSRQLEGRYIFYVRRKGSLWIFGISEGWTAWTMTQKSICTIKWFKEVSNPWQCWKGMLGLDSQAVNGGLNPAGTVALSTFWGAEEWHCTSGNQGTGGQWLWRIRDEVIVKGTIVIYQTGKEKRSVTILRNSHVLPYQVMKTSHFGLQFPNTSSFFFFDVSLPEKLRSAAE